MLLLPHKRARVEYHPLGVLGVIAPWNYPFHNLLNHIIAGLFSGNAVVSKVRGLALQQLHPHQQAYTSATTHHYSHRSTLRGRGGTTSSLYAPC